VQTHFTKFGRVELDPLRVPMAGAAARREGGFARQLDAAVQRPTHLAEAPEPAVERATTPPAAGDASGSAMPPAAAPCARAPRQAASATTASDHGAEAGAPSIALPTGESGRPLATGSAPPAAAPASSSAAGSEPDVAPPPPSAAGTALDPPPRAAPVPVGSAAVPATAAASTSNATTAGLAGVSTVEGRPATAATPTAVAGYRSLARLAVDRLEAARDSVLRQVLFKLQDGRSEAHLQLEPPELGALDLRLVVEDSGQTKLSVVAERPEIADLLSQHMPALASTLAGRGLNLTEADVRSRDGRQHAASQAHRRPAPGPSAPAGAAEPAPTKIRISTAGLDFWA